MLSKLKLLARDTVIYGASTILSRSLNYLLVPLYANKLSTFDNGVQTLVYANIALANVLFSYGLETAYLKSASDSLREGKDGKGFFSTAFFSLLVTATLFSLIIVFFSADISVLLGMTPAEYAFVRYAAIILWIDTILVIPFAELRLKRKAVQFAIARVTGVVAVVIAAMILVIPFHAGLQGAFIANIIGSAVSGLMVFPVFMQLRPFFSFHQFRELIQIGLPYVPAGIAGLLIHLIDRNILIRISSSDIERIYGEGYVASDILGIYGRVVAFGIILQLFIQVFRFAWQPFFLQHASDPDAKRLFRYVLSISTLFTMVLALASTFFVPDLVRYHYADRFYLLPPRYWIGLSVLPWIFLSYVFDMISTNLTAGLLITGNTRSLPMVTFSGALVTSLVCWALVPVNGMEGAAYAIVAGTFVMCLVMAYYSLKFYPNRYDWLKLSLLLAVGGVFAGIGLWFETIAAGMVLIVLVKIALLVLFFLLVVFAFNEEVRLVAEKIAHKLKKR
ncbi:lipopolysaccharide biosynthesis protein [Chlorobium phaeobacteroides]|jgi:O-antigen/teichoic acid export membrane protein|uniref:Polysaccharide biosynthesis protein n=1 Tax=Chlorobium phaeobacteroides (strain DSM 266 / SMG 266 / 2430) TaxID=290317 RepID=A1BDI5_CHLPD|nr:oligosaccharide flippase family protein [Chlorobium phaeobacteroides]ABL64462.1 polysaccharide biosynthesis protein [Chlorobium phaeobacteroides DSM 266]MBV5319771.1 oligosaccharide flippase family protein [Chlorobium phaeobacteroides]